MQSDNPKEDDNWQFFVYIHKRSNYKLVSLLLSVQFLLEPPICIANIVVDSTSFPCALSTHKELLSSRELAGRGYRAEGCDYRASSYQGTCHAGKPQKEKWQLLCPLERQDWAE